MILNMSTNKKSHHYLADKHIISFIIASFQMKFSQNYSSLAENTALKRTLQNIMQILTRLIDESIVSLEVLNSNVLPVFSKIERQLKNDSVFYNNISMINKKLNESNFCNKIHTAYNTHGISIDRNRQQSFV